MRILVVEDELEMASLVRKCLEKAGYVVDLADSIAVATEAAISVCYDLAVLDRQLDDGDGTELIGILRQKTPDMPILVLSALKDSQDKVAGLNLGADDYLAKPFVVDELVARVRALLRRPGTSASVPLKFGNLTVDINLGQVQIGAEPLDLPRREFLLLESLMRRAGRTVRRSLIEEEVYGTEDEVQPNALDPHVSRLRRKLSDAGADIDLHTVRGLGYLLRLGT